MPNVVRKVLGPYTSQLANGNAVVDTISMLDGVPISEFCELRFRFKTSQALTGAGAVLDIYLQRPVSGTVPAPDTDEDWDDFASLPQFGLGGVDRVLAVPMEHPQAATWAAVGTASHVQAVYTLAADSILPGHWGDAIRIGAKSGGGASGAAIYTVEVTGIRGAD